MPASGMREARGSGSAVPPGRPPRAQVVADAGISTIPPGGDLCLELLLRNRGDSLGAARQVVADAGISQFWSVLFDDEGRRTVVRSRFGPSQTRALLNPSAAFCAASISPSRRSARIWISAGVFSGGLPPLLNPSAAFCATIISPSRRSARMRI